MQCRFIYVDIYCTPGRLGLKKGEKLAEARKMEGWHQQSKQWGVGE